MLTEIQTLTDRFLAVRNQSTLLCRPLMPEDFVVQPIVDVSPPKWHLAHTTWFFEQFILMDHMDGYQWYNADYPYFFNSYYESVGSRVLRPNRGNMTRPTTDDILRYRIHVDSAMLEFLDAGDIGADLLKVIELGLQHEQQHQELLLTDIKYILGNNPLFPVYDTSEVPVTTKDTGSRWIEKEGGNYEIGHAGNGFCFDNELGRHTIFLHDYALLDRLVTNEEYIEFIIAGGYSRFQYWLAEGWDWVLENGITAPYYWAEVEGQWHSYTLQGFRPVDLHEPVTHISYYEADAFARWKGLRLPTEFEWEVMARQFEASDIDNSNFVDEKAFRPVARSGQNRQFFGDVWEWTSSAYLPYPYYSPPEGALGEYNGKFMVNQKVLRGGSCATPKDHMRTTYRNFWHPHLRWQFNGLRLAKHV